MTTILHALKWHGMPPGRSLDGIAMAKARITYLVMVLVFAGGLWAILRIGSRLHGPPNVAGEWQLQWTGAPADIALPDRLAISQSGRFLTVTLEGTGRRQPPVKLQGTLTSRSGTEPTTQLALGNPSSQWLMSGQLDAPRQTLSGHLDAPVHCDWQARRPATPAQ